MKLTKGKLSKLLNKKKQSLKRYKKKGTRGNKRRTFRQKNATYDLSRKTLRQRGGNSNLLDGVTLGDFFEFFGRKFKGEPGVDTSDPPQDPETGLEKAAEDQQNALEKEKAEAEAKKKAEEAGLPPAEETSASPEGEGEGQGEEGKQAAILSDEQKEEDLAEGETKANEEANEEVAKMDEGAKMNEPGEAEAKVEGEEEHLSNNLETDAVPVQEEVEPASEGQQITEEQIKEEQIKEEELKEKQMKEEQIKEAK
jgi:hypothetical protein